MTGLKHVQEGYGMVLAVLAMRVACRTDFILAVD
jgi:hypothetical protein